MAIDFTAKYPGRFDPVSALYPQGKFKNRSAPNTEDGSYMERDWLNDWNGFFGALLKNANITPNGTVDTATTSQLYDALRLVTGGKYGTTLIGSLVHWPLQQMPQEIFTDLGQVYIPYIAQAFDKSRYPLLGMLHPSGVLPADMRAMIVKGFDAGRGLDSGRALMSFQPGSLIYGDDDWIGGTSSLAGLNSGNRAASSYGVPSPANYPNAKGTLSNIVNNGSTQINFNATGVAQVDSVAWNTIVRAA
ncbi:MAG: hypothetical protein ACRCWC_15740 [Plesiomonas shigelloides]